MMESLVGYPDELLLLLVIVVFAQFVIRLISPKTKIGKQAVPEQDD